MKVFFREDFYQVYTHDPAAEPGRLEAVMNVIKSRVEIVPAEPASEQDILAVHSQDHVESVKARGLYPIAALAAGGAVQAAVFGFERARFRAHSPSRAPRLLQFQLGLLLLQ